MLTQKHGRPWDINNRYETFKEADIRRNDILNNKNNKYDVKVKRLYIGDNNWAFFVKTRIKKEFVHEKKNKKKTRGKRNRIHNKDRKSNKQAS